jgi:hypothetical protein
MKKQDVQKKYLYTRTVEKIPPLKPDNCVNIKITCVLPSKKRLNSYDGVKKRLNSYDGVKKRLNSYDKVEKYSKLWYVKHNFCAVDIDCQLGVKCPMSVDLINHRENFGKIDYFNLGYSWYENGCN